MANEEKVKLDVSALKVLDLSFRIYSASNMSCNNTLTGFIGLILLDESPLYRRMIDLKITKEQIEEISVQLISNNLENCKEETPQMILDLSSEGYIFSLSSELYSILNEASYISKKNYDKSSVGINELIAAYCEKKPDLIDDFLSLCSAYTGKEIIKMNREAFIEQIVIPRNISGCLRILNSNFKPDEMLCEILGRDTETLELLRILSKCKKRNAVLVGPTGVGKTAITEKLTWMIVTGNCPESFKNSIIISLDINALISGTKYRGSAEQRFEDLIHFLENNPNCILFIDEIHTLLGAGACRDGDLDLANALKPILARGDTQVIGATTSEEYERYFSRDSALKRRFEKILVREPKTNEIYPMIKNQIKKLSEFHHVEISEEIVGDAIFYASCFNKETRNPDRTLDLIDNVMASVCLTGRSHVTKNDILGIFSSKEDIFNKTPTPVKIALAYHEAGHYIVHRYSNLICNYKTIALSIMPAENYLGAHVYELDEEILSLNSLEYYIQLIGCKLAGRIGEEMFSKQLSSGASSDIETATNIAKDVVVRYGLVPTFSTYRSYGTDEKLVDSKVIARANEEVDFLLEKSRMYAKYILKHHSAELEKVVNALLKNHMLSAKELDALF